MSEKNMYSLSEFDMNHIARDGMLRIAKDDKLTIIYANDKYFEIIGKNDDDYSRVLSNYILPEDTAFVKNAFIGTDIGEQCYITFRIKDSADNVKWLSISGYMTDVKYGEADTLICSVSDITVIKNYSSEIETTYNNVSCGLVQFYADDGKFKITKHNRYYLTMPGNSTFDFESGLELNVYHEDLPVVTESVLKRSKDKKSVSVDYRAVADDGSVYWVNMNVSPVGNSEGRQLYLAVIFDITQKKNAIIELEKERERYAAMRNNEDVIFEYDYSTDECIFCVPDRSSIVRNSKSYVVDNFIEKISAGRIVCSADIQLMRDAWYNSNFDDVQLRVKVDGDFRWYYLHGNVIFSQDKKPIKIIGSMQNIDDFKKQEEKLDMRSKLDVLSKVYVREAAITEIDSYLENMPVGEKTYLCLIDLDNFKKINDEYGYLYGDAVITMAAASIRDIVGNDNIIGRFGGDEFVVLIKNSTDEIVRDMIDRIIRSILKLRVDSNDVDGISCSGGISCSRDVSIATYNNLFKIADKALYKAKVTGKNHFEFYDPDDKIMMHGRRLSREHSGNAEYSTKDVEVDIMSVAFEILDRSDNIHDAVRMLLKHIGAVMRLEKIKIFQVNQNTNEVVIAYAWNRDVNIPEKEGNRGFYVKEDIEEYVRLFNKSTIVRFQPSVIKRFSLKMQDQLNKLNDRIVFYGAVINSEEEFSMILYQCDDLERSWTQNEINILQELTKVLSVYLSRDKKLEAAENRMAKMLNYDELTGAHTLKRFRELAQRSIEEGGNEFIMVYSDFVHFKYINDLYGYEIGDEILCDFAQFIAPYKNSELARMARISGDEFVMIAPAEDKDSVICGLQQVFGDYCRKKNSKYPLANLIIRAGVYFMSPSDDAILAIDRANLARKSLAHLTATKVAVFDENIYKQLMLEAEMSRSMRSALQNGEFVAFLQPKVDITTLEVVGAEALVRWFKEDGTMMPPYLFIPYFERNGFVTEIDFCIFKQVVRFIANRQSRGEKIVPISVNLSRVNARTHDLADRIIKYVEKYNVSPDYIEFEITETVFDEMESSFIENINQLREYGFKIDIDDFGSGYSSLNMLSEMPADIIKLDKSLITRSLESERKAEVIKHTVYMIAAIDCDVICEGVETKEEVEFLKKIGCNKVQGFYFARPMPVKDFCEMVDKKLVRN